MPDSGAPLLSEAQNAVRGLMVCGSALSLMDSLISESSFVTSLLFQVSLARVPVAKPFTKAPGKRGGTRILRPVRAGGRALHVSLIERKGGLFFAYAVQLRWICGRVTRMLRNSL